jgi:hypothetical protein
VTTKATSDGRARKLSEPQLWLVSYLRERFHRARVESEWQFVPDRKWRFDVVCVSAYGGMERWAFEVEGGLFMCGTGRHNRGAGMRSDMEKYNRAAADGWQVYRFTPEQILKGNAKVFIEEWL